MRVGTEGDERELKGMKGNQKGMRVGKRGGTIGLD